MLVGQSNGEIVVSTLLIRTLVALLGINSLMLFGVFGFKVSRLDLHFSEIKTDEKL